MSWLGGDPAEGYQINAGIVGPTDIGAQYPSIEAYDQATAADDQKAIDAAKNAAASLLPSVPWWVWGSIAMIGIIVFLHELNPTIGLLTAVRKGG